MNAPLPAVATSVTLAEIAAALGISKQAAAKKAERESWPFESVPVRGGKKHLFPVVTLPVAVRAPVQRHRLGAAIAALPALTLPISSSPASTAAGALPADRPERQSGFFIPCADMTDEQRLRADARRGVLAELGRLRAQAGCSQEAAMQTLLTLAASGQASPFIVRALLLARDGRGKKGKNDLPSVRTLKRWIGAEDLTPKVPQKNMSVPPWAKVFLTHYQQPQKPSVDAAYREACKDWTAGERPSIHQVRHFLDKLGTVTRERGRMGPRELKSLRPYVTRSFDQLEPNDIWSADGHTFDAEVQHPYHGRPFRPEITTIVDIATRRIVGWSVALAESGTAVLDALRYAAEFAGLAAIFYVDKGSGYDNDLLKDEGTGLAGRMGFEVKHSIAYNSQARGVIERLHKTVWVEGAKLLPSYMGAAMDREARLAQFKITRKAVKAGGAVPLLPWHLFMDFIAARVSDYNARAHRTLGGVSPDLKWREFEARGWQAHRLAAVDLDTLYRPRVMRTILRGRVTLFTNYYSNNALEEFHGDRVMVAYDLHKVDKVWIYTPEGRAIGEALVNGNTRHYYPRPVVEQAREKRVGAAEKRIKVKLAAVREELHGPALEAPKANEIVIAGPAIKIADAVAAGQYLIGGAPSAEVIAMPLPRSQRPIADVAAEWLALDARIAAGEKLDEEDAWWHGGALRNPALRVAVEDIRGQAHQEKRATG
jgi:putative transposase